MKKSKIILALIVLAILASNTACSSIDKEELIESSVVTSETMSSTSILQTTAPTETTPEQTFEETIEVTPEPTESMSELEKRISYMRDLHSGQIKYSTYYLKMDQEVNLRDVQAADGILLEDLGTTTLLAGTVLTPLLSSGEMSMDLSVDTIFVLVDGRCVTFDISSGEDGELRANGYPADEIFGHVTGSDYPDRLEKEEGELRAMEGPEWDVIYKVLTITTDWNEDGVMDSFRRELENYYDGPNDKLIFTDGATGESTDVTDCLTEPDDGLYEILTAGAFLYEDQDGNRMIIDSYDYCSEDYATYVYTYDPVKFIVKQEFEGVFDIVDGEMILERDSKIFGNHNTMIYPVTIADGQFKVADDSTEIYWQESWHMDPDSSAFPNFYSCTLQDITAERIIGDAIQTITIPVGVAIFPLYTVVDESGAGVFYFRTVADGNCQMSYVLKNDWNPIFDGKEQRDLFWCAFGG